MQIEIGLIQKLLFVIINYVFRAKCGVNGFQGFHLALESNQLKGFETKQKTKSLNLSKELHKLLYLGKELKAQGKIFQVILLQDLNHHMEQKCLGFLLCIEHIDLELQ